MLGNPPFSFSISFPFSFSLLYEFFLLLYFLFFFLSFAFLFLFWITIDQSWSKEETSFPLPPCHMSFPCFFLIYFFISLFLFIASYLMWLIVSNTFQVHHMDLSMCHSLRVPCGIPQSHHVSFDTLRLEKREIPTVSEFDEIRCGN